MGVKFGLGASIAYEKINTEGTDENLFRLVPSGVSVRAGGLGAQISAPTI